MGFDCVEIAGICLPLPDGHAALADWSARLRHLALEPRFHCSPANNRYFPSPDEALRSGNLRSTIRDIEAAARLGIHAVVIHPGAADGPEGRRRVVTALEILQEHAAGVEIQLELECASGPFNGNPRELVELCRKVDGIALALDMAHAFRSVFCLDGEGTLDDWISIAAPWIRSIQFTDLKSEGERFVPAVIGDGVLPYERMMPRLLALDCPWWTIELVSIQQLAESKTYLERFIQVSIAEPCP